MNDKDFERLLTAHRGDFYAFVRNRYRLQSADVDDMVQDSMLKMWRARSSFDGRHFKAWGLMIIRNTVISTVRATARHRIAEHDTFHRDERIPGEQEDYLEVADTMRKMTMLTAPHREAIVLMGRGDDYAEAALAANVPAGTIKSRLHRARASLRHALEGVAP